MVRNGEGMIGSPTNDKKFTVCLQRICSAVCLPIFNETCQNIGNLLYALITEVIYTGNAYHCGDSD